MVVGGAFAEVKRMYVRPQFCGFGLSKSMLKHLTDYTQDQGIGVLRLETGIHQRAALALYEHAGFRRIPPLADYSEDPIALCYDKRLR